MKRTIALCGLLGLLSTACESTEDRRVHPDQPDAVGGAVLRSQDIRTMTDQMARDLSSHTVLRDAPAGQRISFYMSENGLINESSEPINTRMILTRLRTGLFRALDGKVQVLDRSSEALEDMQKERAAKRSGAVSSKEEMQKDVAGADYILKGLVQDRQISDGEMKSAYYLVTFELTDLESGELRWTNDFETKFESDKSVISR